jgi:hypothetical protein
MSKSRLLSSATLVAMMFLAACGGDGATQPGDMLSADQVQSMASALTALIGTSLFARNPSAASPAHFNARDMMSAAEPVTGSSACPEGGRLGVNGTFSPDDSGHILFALSDTLVDCGIRDNKSNVWTFTSQPTLEISIVEGFDGDSTDVQQFTVRQTDVGRVKYATGSLSGVCSMDVAIQSVYSFHTPTADSTTLSLHTAGSLCGRSLARDTSIKMAVPSPP